MALRPSAFCHASGIGHVEGRIRFVHVGNGHVDVVLRNYALPGTLAGRVSVDDPELDPRDISMDVKQQVDQARIDYVDVDAVSPVLNPSAWDEIEAGALVVANHSGGKDSQATLIALSAVVPREQLLVIHAHLPEVEWAGTWDMVKDGADRRLLPAISVEANKTLLEMVERRGMWPSASTRQCTSDLKRGPISKAIRHFLKDNPSFNGRVISAMGLRAEESSARRKQPAWVYEARESKAGRTWHRWLPIHDWDVDRVFQAISAAGEEPHPVYRAGMTRLSCCFCILASRADLTRAAELNPVLYRRYVELEKRLGHTVSMSGRSLEEITGIPVLDEAA